MLALPKRFQLVFRDSYSTARVGSGSTAVSIWRPVPPPGCGAAYGLFLLTRNIHT